MAGLDYYHYDYNSFTDHAAKQAYKIITSLNIIDAPVKFDQIDKLPQFSNVIERHDNLFGCDGYTMYKPSTDEYLMCYDLFEYGYYRARFTKAHEYAHILFKHFFYDLNDKTLLKRFDYDANAFANELLMPRNILFKYNSWYTLEELSNIFQVNTTALEVKFDILKKKNPNKFIGVCSDCNIVTFFSNNNTCPICNSSNLKANNKDFFRGNIMLNCEEAIR